MKTLNPAGTTRSALPKLRRRNRGFTMFEILIVMVGLGILAALIVPVVQRYRAGNLDVVKTHNAKQMTEYMTTLFEAGVDTSVWADGASAITALQTGVTLPAAVPGGTQQVIKLNETVNSAAYTFTAGVANVSPPKFAAILGDSTQRP